MMTWSPLPPPPPRQIKYKYIPFTMGKKRYATKETVDHPAHGPAGKGKAS